MGEDEDSGCYQLEVDCPRFMDTSFMECDIQPTYVRITIKGKVSAANQLPKVTEIIVDLCETCMYMCCTCLQCTCSGCPQYCSIYQVTCDVHVYTEFPSWYYNLSRTKLTRSFRTLQILQLVLPEEVSPDRSTAQRSHTTGKLLLTMPKVKPVIKSAKSAVPMTSTTLGITKHKAAVGTGTNNKLKQEVKNSTCVSKTTEGGLLEVDPSLKSKTAKLASIVKLTGDVDTVSHHERTSDLATKKEPPPTLMKEGPAYLSDFVDDPDVPPLI